MYHYLYICNTDACVEGNVRLQGGLDEIEGRLEVCVSNSWVAVCNTTFENIDASVVCSTLGFSRFREFEFLLFQCLDTYMHII